MRIPAGNELHAAFTEGAGAVEQDDAVVGCHDMIFPRNLLSDGGVYVPISNILQHAGSHSRPNYEAVMPRLLRTALPVLTLLAASFTATAVVFSATTRAPEVVAHEWGTFTTVAGEDGQAINWLPLGGPSDLPCFVETYKNRQFKILGNLEQEGPIDYAAARSALVGTVRMETPVIYFYSPEEAQVSVNVKFPRGLITEWYPKATVNQPNIVSTILDKPDLVGGVSWPMVQILPARVGEFPQGAGRSHYYAARETDAAPLLAYGQFEKFLFYRGVASFPAVISAALNSDGSVRVKNLGSRPIPGVILFENKAGTMTYHVGGALDGVATLPQPANRSGLAALRAELLTMLEKTGLYKKEAQAMLETWGDSWFEEGTRVFYVVPPASVDEILPLTITPAPAAVARAFVGRMEIITPDALVRVHTALAANDEATLESHGRFLGPITDRLIARTQSVSDRNRIRAVTNTVFSAYVKRMSTCN